MAIDKDAMRAAFNAGWAAACMTLADLQTDAEVKRGLYAMANRPPPVEVGDLSTPEGQAMRRGSEVVFRDEVRRATPGADDNGGNGR